MKSLWGEEFSVPNPNTKTILDKIKNPKTTKNIVTTSIKSSKLNLEQKLDLIKTNVYRILGRYAQNTIVITSKESLHKYIDASIKNGEIAIDTETNNSLDPITCKLMGGCIYTPGQKQAYIPINHINPITNELLNNQLTENDLKDEFTRLTNTKIIMHNGKFDYQVIKCTCGIPLKVYWDTMIGARLLDENEKSAGLKEQYIDKIDFTVEKYSIDHLFKDIEYAVVDPQLFALYASTDAYMTYKLYKYQLEQFDRQENKKLKKLFLDVEMPVMEVTAEMELTGIELDIPYANRLGEKYHKISNSIENEIYLELKKYDKTIAEWRKTEDANFHVLSKKPNKNGEFIPQKSKNEQLHNPVEVSSPTQLAILLYDILKISVIDKKTPRGTGEDILKKIDLPLCKLILKKRGLDKLINTYIDKLPKCVNIKDHRLHAKFNSVEARTGRFSSSDPNLQNIPSHNKEIRMMFKATDGEYEISQEDNYFLLNKWDLIETDYGWKKVYDLTTNDYIQGTKINYIEDVDGLNYKVYIE